MGKIFRSDDLRYLYVIYISFLRNHGILLNHIDVEDDFYRQIYSLINDINTAPNFPTEDSRKFFFNSKYQDLIENVLRSIDKLLGTDLHHELFGGDTVTVNSALQERFPNQQLEEVGSRFADSINIKLEEYLILIQHDLDNSRAMRDAHEKLIYLFIFLEYFSRTINSIADQHWFKKRLFQLEREYRVNKGNESGITNNWFRNAGRKLTALGEEIGSGVREVGDNVGGKVHSFWNWFTNIFRSDEQVRQRESQMQRERRERDAWNRKVQNLKNREKKCAFITDIVVNLVLEVEDFLKDILNSMVFCDMKPQELLTMTSQPENPDQYNAMNTELGNVATAIKETFSAAKIREHVRGVLFVDVPRIKKLALQKRSVFGPLLSQLVQVDDKTDWSNFAMAVQKLSGKDVNITDLYLAMLEESKHKRSIRNAFALFFRTPLNVFSGRSLESVYRKKERTKDEDEEEEELQETLEELPEDANLLSKAGHQVKKGVKFVGKKAKQGAKFVKGKVKSGWENFKNKVSEFFSSSKNTITIRYKETILMLSNRFGIKQHNMRNIFIIYTVFVFVIPIVANVALIVLAIFFPIPWIASVVIIGISIPFYCNALYLIGCVFSSFNFNLEKAKVNNFGKNCRTLRNENPELFTLFVDLCSLKREDFAQIVREFIEKRTQILRKTNMEFMNPIAFKDILEEEQQKLMDYLMNIYDRTQLNPLQNEHLQQKELMQKELENTTEVKNTMDQEEKSDKVALDSAKAANADKMKDVADKSNSTFKLFAEV